MTEQKTTDFSLEMRKDWKIDLSHLEEAGSFSTPPISPKLFSGSFRYLKGSELAEEDLRYDIGMIVYRGSSLPECTRNNDSTSFNPIGNFGNRLKRMLSYRSDSSSPCRDGGERRLIEHLVAKGLLVDIIDGGFAPLARGSRKSEYFILLLRAPEHVVVEYAKQLKIQMWLRCGNARELSAIVKENNLSKAERIQVVDHIIRESSPNITERHDYVRAIFPLHDKKANNYLLQEFVGSTQLEYKQTDKFLEHLKLNFGEKITYYFAFIIFYNQSLFPIAIIGVLITILREFISVENYMRVLVFWGMLVSIIWSFYFLKSWIRRNNELNFEWNNSLQSEYLKYPNPDFFGECCVNSITGLPDIQYPAWKRYPKYMITIMFMFVQIVIMMFLIVFWITIFEILKVRYPESHIFSVQWWSILLGGICFGLFVDIFQWNVIVTKVARFLTRWENWKTVEEHQRSLIRKLFLMDFLNYYTWFFLLAFVYVIPGTGDRITNFLNTAFWNDPPNCCFGSYMSENACVVCPTAWNNKPLHNDPSRCVPCKGYATFDRAHLNLESLFLTPIIVTQGLNLLLAILIPWLNRKRDYRNRRKVDKKAMSFIKHKGKRKIIADMDYGDDDLSHLANMSTARYIENDDDQVELLNAKAREIMYESKQDNYDPYDDYHVATVQYGFVVMFSMLWPLMPMACIIINSLKMRGDAFRLSQTLKRPFPRKASGIGEWQTVLYILGCTGVIVYVALVFVSSGAIEFFSPQCVAHIESALNYHMENFHFGPYFSCFSVTTRVVMLLICEHIAFGIIWILHHQIRNVPKWLEIELMKKEYQFKAKLQGKSRKRSSKRLGKFIAGELVNNGRPKNNTPTAYNTMDISSPNFVNNDKKSRQSFFRKWSISSENSDNEKEPLLSSGKVLSNTWDEDEKDGK